ncbi:MAG TPA: SulP family inorganic anion transporter [Chlamydiales bacterium]|nr:SulP family inorganic anion transporter [Chlamydiales bacterium]
MTLQVDEISLRPLKKDIARYSWATFRHDMWAGLTVALLSIPQALAYSLVLGLPPYCGIMATIFGTAICALAGSSRHLVIGPNNTTVLLVQAATATILQRFYHHIQDPLRDEVAMQVMSALLLLIGIIQIGFALFKMGRVIQFVSFPVVLGYILGSSVAIIAGQLYTFLGIELPEEDVPSLFEKLRYLLSHLTSLQPATALIGALSLSVLLTLKKLKLKAPSSLLMLLIITPLVYILHLNTIPDAHGHVLSVIGDAGKIEVPIPHFQLPLFELRLLNVIVPTAFAIALVSMLETTAIAKSIAVSSGQRLSTNQEFFGLGCANFVLSFMGSLPASGSLSRTTLNYESGAKTRFAAIYSAIFVAAGVLFFGDLIQFIPLSALAALIVATAMRAVDKKHFLLCLRATHSDAVVLAITFLSCIFFQLHIAFYLGVAISIILHLRKAAVPEVVEYSYNSETTELLPVTAAEKPIKRSVRLINVEGELFFGSVDLFQSTLKAIAEDDEATRVFILRLKHVRDFDASAATALRHLNDFLRKQNRYLIVAAIPQPVWIVLENARLIQHIGKENLFLLDERDPNKSVELAFDRAAFLTQSAERRAQN